MIYRNNGDWVTECGECDLPMKLIDVYTLDGERTFQFECRNPQCGYTEEFIESLGYDEGRDGPDGFF